MFATAMRFMAKKAKPKRDKPANMNIGLEGQKWSGTMRQIVKEKGPLTVAGFWEQAQIAGIRSKRHMKIILRWMKGQNQVKMVCNHLGHKHSPTEKEFFYAYVVPKSERVAARQEAQSVSADRNDSPVPTDAPSSLDDKVSHQISEEAATPLSKL